MQKELKYATIGEFVVWNLFSHLKNCKQIVDVRDDERFREYDVDFLIEDCCRQFHWLEVKTDSMAHKTQNIAYEVLSNKRIQSQGCFEKTKAEMIAYYIEQSNQILMIDTDKLRELAHSGKYELRDMGDNAQGYLIPLADLKPAIKKIYMV